MKKTKRIILVCVLTIFISFVIAKPVFASPFSLADIFKAAKEFVSGGDAEKADLSEIMETVQPIINTVYWIGIAIILGCTMYLGVQYFALDSNAQKKAELQGKLVGFVISSVVLISAYPIWKFILELMSVAEKVVN